MDRHALIELMLGPGNVSRPYQAHNFSLTTLVGFMLLGKPNRDPQTTVRISSDDVDAVDRCSGIETLHLALFVSQRSLCLLRFGIASISRREETET